MSSNAMRVAAVASLVGSSVGLELQAGVAANPVRKVVNLLQAMQKKVQAEGEKEEKLYEEFMCYCKTGTKDLAKSIDDAEAKISEFAANLKESKADLAQTSEELAQHKQDRVAGQKCMDEATGLREKEAATFAKFKTEHETNIAAIHKAVAALERGMEGGFLQTSAAGVLRSLLSQVTMNEDDRSTVMSFLSGPAYGAGYAPASGQITGILKQMGDEMTADLKDATAAEKKAIQEYEQLMDTRLQEKKTLTAAIETKLEKEADLKVSIAEMQNEHEDTMEGLAADEKFLAELKTGCATKTAEWNERQKLRADELLALADTIKILNNDDALELFKKTLPSASAASSFMQLAVTRTQQKAQALAALRAVSGDHARLDLIALALQGKKIAFDEVIGMIDELVATLKKEQVDDDNKKVYCNKQLDQADDKKKGLERDISNLETSIATAKEDIATFSSEIANLKAGIIALDKSVAEATKNRKAEHEEYNDLIASNTAAKEVLNLAKNRLNQFYNPKLAKATKEASSFVQVTAHTQLNKEAPPPPPETFGAYSKKGEENGSVISMVNLLIADLDKEMTVAETEEKNAQEEYETLMADSADKRTADSKSLTEKEGALADTEKALDDHEGDMAEATKELGSTVQVISDLHAECDWLLKYFDVRAEARASEIDALGNAKAVLNGADYSL